MRQRTLTIVAMVSAFALMATPALAADQSRSQDRTHMQLQDGTCENHVAECDQTQACVSEQTRACEETATQECVAAQVQAGDPTQAQTQAGTQVQTQTRAGDPTLAQLHQGDQEQVHAPEWEDMLARHKKDHAKQYAKRAHAVASID